MANPAVVTLSAVGQSNWIPINLNAFNNGVGIICVVQGSPTVNYDVQVTGDRINSNIPPNQVPTHVGLLDNMNGLSGSKNGSLAYPCTAVRLNINSISGGTSPSVTLMVVQSVD